MPKDAKEWIVVKILLSKPKNLNYTVGSIKFVPTDKLPRNYKVKKIIELNLEIFFKFKGLIGEKLIVKITSRTTIECEVLDPSIEIVNPSTPILVSKIKYYFKKWVLFIFSKVKIISLESKIYF